VYIFTHPGFATGKNLCSGFSQEIESFLKRVFKAAGFPEEGIWGEENPKEKETK
jgi:hypothetical protein